MVQGDAASPASGAALLTASSTATTAATTAAVDATPVLTTSACHSGVAAWGSGEVEGWIGAVLSDGGPLQALCQSIVSVNDIDGPKLLAMDSEKWKDFGLMHEPTRAKVCRAVDKLRHCSRQ
jgi:hypothetical protein